MIKYSLIALTAAAVLFSVGCEDSACCSTGKVTKNVAPKITKVLGATAGSEIDCSVKTTKNLYASETDVNGNVDTSTYSWVERVGTNDAPITSKKVNCPADGEKKKICATVKDKEGLESKEVCVTLVGKEVASSDTCPTELKVTVNGNENFSQFDKTNANFGDYNISTNFSNCPQVNCTWTVHSFRDDNTDFNCITLDINGSASNVSEEHIKSYNGTELKSYANSSKKITITPKICGSLYKRVEINATCTRDGSSTEFKTTKTFTINN